MLVYFKPAYTELKFENTLGVQRTYGLKEMKEDLLLKFQTYHTQAGIVNEMLAYLT